MKGAIRVKKADLIAVAALLLAAGALLLLRPAETDRLTAEVIVNGETLYSVALADVEAPYTLTLDNGVVLEISPDGARFADSPCAGRDCVRCGKLTKAGQTAACLPKKTLIVLRGARQKNAPDAISY